MHTKASILVLVWKFSRRILFKILVDLKPLIVVLLAWSPMSLLDVKSTVSNLEHVGHDTRPKEAEKSIKHALQNTCSQEVTWNNNGWILNKQKLAEKLF